MKNIILETERVVMKSPIGMVDSNDILSAINNKQTLQFLSSAPSEYTLETAESFLDYLKSVEASEHMLELGVFEKETNSFVGMMTIEDINYDNHSCELGYWLSKEYTGKGIAYESAKELIDFVCNSLGMKVIKAYVIKEHRKSISLLEKLGFIQKELLLNNEENKGVMVDRYLYVLNN
ncbi:GNAT family N-acetyltransferase [Oceanirhabdus sp. W0125-5]|uniref:GNAT family N-acetyltransferase n=1 Tax=Oceanirhabdus sp. W0125-5 TaxID=2999116 RepID=UPI0022F30F90|nr:GNAT family protein [Oceanirhabdus sp. W0125-5]WBW96844.1 GNAT family protein [Oceanirhabdus sp. W0125-5]